VKSLRRADLVVITRSESVDPSQLQHLRDSLLKHVSSEQLVVMETRLTGFADLSTAAEVETSVAMQRPVILFSAIANPGSFSAIAQHAGLDIVDHWVFADHHRYGKNDLRKLSDLSEQHKCPLVTTAKDAVKIDAAAFADTVCFVAEIEFAFVAGEDIFMSRIREAIK
jgi:tetraacyldisaccharide 4'-kinase